MFSRNHHYLDLNYSDLNSTHSVADKAGLKKGEEIRCPRARVNPIISKAPQKYCRPFSSFLHETTMASHRKEPLKRRDSESTYFVSPSIMALLLALLFVVAFKVDDDGKLLRSSPYFCSLCRVSSEASA